MKDITQYLTEEVKDHDKGIIDMLKFFAQACSGVQQELFNKKVEDANSVDVVPLSEVFTEDEIKEIKKRIHHSQNAVMKMHGNFAIDLNMKESMKSNIVKDI